jgi:hypothetical protein
MQARLLHMTLRSSRRVLGTCDSNVTPTQSGNAKPSPLYNKLREMGLAVPANEGEN